MYPHQVMLILISAAVVLYGGGLAFDIWRRRHPKRPPAVPVEVQPRGRYLDH